MKMIEVPEQFVKDAYAVVRDAGSLQSGGNWPAGGSMYNLMQHFIRDVPDGIIHVAGSAYVIEDYP